MYGLAPGITAGCEVASWHEADMGRTLRDVRLVTRSGAHCALNLHCNKQRDLSGKCRCRSSIRLALMKPKNSTPLKHNGNSRSLTLNKRTGLRSCQLALASRSFEV